MTKSQILNPTPTLMTQDTLRPGRPEDPIPRGVRSNASAALERREAGVRQNIEKKSEVNSTGKDQNAERPSMISNQGWPSSKFSATSAGNSSSLGGSMRRFRAQCSGGLQGRQICRGGKPEMIFFGILAICTEKIKIS